MARRVRFLQEMELLKKIKVYHISGKINPKNALTKYVAREEIRALDGVPHQHN